MGSEEECASAVIQQLYGIGGGPSGDIPNPFVVRYGDYVIKVMYGLGSTKQVTLQAKYDEVTRANQLRANAYRGAAVRSLVAPRPLAIQLRRNHGDGPAKPWRSGDDAFDRAIMTDTMSEPEVLAAVLNPDARRGVLDLFALGFHDLVIDHEEISVVEACLVEFSSREPPDPNRGAASLRAFAQILANLPTVTASGRTRTSTPLFPLTLSLLAVGGLGWVVPVIYLAETEPNVAWSEIAIGIALAVVAGIVGMLVYGRVVASFGKGMSTLAEGNLVFARVAAFGATAVVVFTAFAVALGLLHAK